MSDINERVLGVGAAIELWRSGKDKWNNWAESHEGMSVSFRGADFSKYRTITQSDGCEETSVPISFSGFIFPGSTDFNSVLFGDGNVDFGGAVFRKGQISFESARFGEGQVLFCRSEFNCESVSFTNTVFGRGHIGFTGAKMNHTVLDFTATKFGDGNVNFSDICLNNVNFWLSIFGKGTVSFRGATFKKIAMFERTTFSDGTVDFGGAIFVDGSAVFSNAEFGNSDVSFKGAKFKFEAVSFKNTKFGAGDVDFSGARFIGCLNVSFNSANFGAGDVDYSGAKFIGCKNISFNGVGFGKGNVDFSNSKFRLCKEIIDFRKIQVNGIAEFDGAWFDARDVAFNKASFEGPVSFMNAKFSSVPDLTLTKFSHHIVISDMELKYPEPVVHRRFLLKYPHVRDAVKLRRLKELAANSKDDRLEQEFFAEELKARRIHYINGFSLFLNYCYQLFSDFGRSVKRPLCWLVILWFTWTIIFYTHANKCYNEESKNCIFWGADSWQKLVDSGLFSLSNLVPFITWSKEVKDITGNALFENVSLLPAAFHFLVFLEAFLSIILLALVVLGLRNQFKLK